MRAAGDQTENPDGDGRLLFFDQNVFDSGHEDESLFTTDSFETVRGSLNQQNITGSQGVLTDFASHVHAMALNRQNVQAVATAQFHGSECLSHEAAVGQDQKFCQFRFFLLWVP